MTCRISLPVFFHLIMSSFFWRTLLHSSSARRASLLEWSKTRNQAAPVTTRAAASRIISVLKFWRSFLFIFSFIEIIQMDLKFNPVFVPDLLIEQKDLIELRMGLKAQDQPGEVL